MYSLHFGKEFLKIKIIFMSHFWVPVKSYFKIVSSTKKQLNFYKKRTEKCKKKKITLRNVVDRIWQWNSLWCQGCDRARLARSWLCAIQELQKTFLYATDEAQSSSLVSHYKSRRKQSSITILPGSNTGPLMMITLNKQFCPLKVTPWLT